MKSRFNIVDRSMAHNIVWIEDCFENGGGLRTVTNDAENVVNYFRSLYGNKVRIVYRDTNMEWWEIDWSEWIAGPINVKFKQWHGLEWDILQRT